MDFDQDHIARNPFVVGAVGALITALRFTPGSTWIEKVLNAASGSAFAGFLVPPIVEWLHMTSPAYVSGAAFMFGLVGMSLAAAILQGIKDTPIGQIVTGWLSRR